MSFVRGTKSSLIEATLILVCTALLMACGPSKQAQTAGTKRYKLTGRVVSVDKQSKAVTVDGDDIPGFMSAMTMPYQVKNASDLDRVAPGDTIAAEIVGRDTEYWLENIQITKHSNAPPGAH